MKQIRIKDIAERAGVSIGTVDRVLHDRGEVAVDTKERVLAIAKQFHYQPNIVARALTSKRQYNIVALLPKGNDDNQFWNEHHAGIEKAIRELKPFRVEIYFYFFELHNGDDFKEKATRVLKFNPDGVIFAPILKKESINFCTELDNIKIPYIFIDTYIEEANCVTFIGEDAFQGGRVAASLIDHGISPVKDILIVNISKDIENTQHLNRRNQGFMSFFLDSGKNKGMKITVEIPSSEMEIVTTRMDNILKSNPNIGAILVSSSKTHVIGRYLEQKNIKGMILVGYETTLKNLEFLKKGFINFLVGQKPMEQSGLAVKRMFEYLTTNQQFPKREFQPVGIINSENMEHFQTR